MKCFLKGMAYGIIPATLPDLMTRYGVDVEVISQAMALGGVGNLIGAPLASAADRCVYIFNIMLFTTGMVKNFFVLIQAQLSLDYNLKGP